MPERIEPTLALIVKKPPSGHPWSYEVKWDGYRLAVHVEPKGVRIITRGGHDWTSYFPAIVAAAKDLGPATMILDGKAVILDAKGLPNFGLLHRPLAAGVQHALPRKRSYMLSICSISTAITSLVLSCHQGVTCSKPCSKIPPAQSSYRKNSKRMARSFWEMPACMALRALSPRIRTIPTAPAVLATGSR